VRRDPKGTEDSVKRVGGAAIFGGAENGTAVGLADSVDEFPRVGESPAHGHRESITTWLVGVPLTLATRMTAIAMLQRLMATGAPQTQWICFLNSHNFNRAMLDGVCRDALSDAYAVFPDGCAIHVAARLCGLHIPENLPGTDLVPAMLESCSGTCFLIGDAPKHIERAAYELQRRFPAWSVAGFTSGYFASEEEERRVVELVNRTNPDLLLIGMGTPLQERFVRRYAGDLRVPLCICVGGLFGYWSGELIRAPRLMRRLGLEWLWILVQQPRKVGRYTIGTARFFATVLRHLRREVTAP